MHVSRALGGVTVLQKGASDIICTNTGEASKEQAELNKVHSEVSCAWRNTLTPLQIKEGESTEERVVVDVPGGLKRCGGQGDILSGTVGTIMAWGKCYESGAFGSVVQCSIFPSSGSSVLFL